MFIFWLSPEFQSNCALQRIGEVGGLMNIKCICYCWLLQFQTIIHQISITQKRAGWKGSDTPQNFLGEDIIQFGGILKKRIRTSRLISLDNRSHFPVDNNVLSIYCGNTCPIYMIWRSNQDMARDQTLCEEGLTTDDNFELNGSTGSEF